MRVVMATTLAPQRQDELARLLDERGTMRTVELAEFFRVTDETIRRDLQVLSDAGRVMRIHGGACSLSGRPQLHSFDQRSEVEVERKRAIARAALPLIEPGLNYAFDSSTTALALVSILPDLPYLVVSNAHPVFERLADKENVELISTGGRYHAKTRTFVGINSVQSLTRHRIDMAIISCVGFSLSKGASEGFEEQALYKEFLVQHAERVILLVDSSKFDRQSDYFFGRVKEIDHVVTDEAIDDAAAERIRQSGVELTIAPMRSGA